MGMVIFLDLLLLLCTIRKAMLRRILPSAVFKIFIFAVPRVAIFQNLYDDGMFLSSSIIEQEFEQNVENSSSSFYIHSLAATIGFVFLVYIPLLSLELSNLLHRNRGQHIRIEKIFMHFGLLFPVFVIVLALAMYPLLMTRVMTTASLSPSIFDMKAAAACIGIFWNQSFHCRSKSFVLLCDSGLFVCKIIPCINYFVGTSLLSSLWAFHLLYTLVSLVYRFRDSL